MIKNISIEEGPSGPNNYPLQDPSTKHQSNANKSARQQ